MNQRPQFSIELVERNHTLKTCARDEGINSSSASELAIRVPVAAQSVVPDIREPLCGQLPLNGHTARLEPSNQVVLRLVGLDGAAHELWPRKRDPAHSRELGGLNDCCKSMQPDTTSAIGTHTFTGCNAPPVSYSMTSNVGRARTSSCVRIETVTSEAMRSTT